MTTVIEQENPNEQTVLVFQLWEGDEGIFFTKKDYMHLKTIDAALEQAKTWREFEALLPTGEFDKLRLWEDEEYIYCDGENYRYIDPNKVAEFVEDYTLSSVLISNDNGVAVINGIPVLVGQHVEGFKLVQVSDNSAVFTSKDGNQQVKLVLEPNAR